MSGKNMSSPQREDNSYRWNASRVSFARTITALFHGEGDLMETRQAGDWIDNGVWLAPTR